MHYAPTELSAAQYVVSIALHVLSVLKVIFIRVVLETQVFVAAALKARGLQLSELSRTSLKDLAQRLFCRLVQQFSVLRCI
jgi:hypothetical protein